MIDRSSGTVLILQRTQPWIRLASFIGFLAAGLFGFLGLDAVLGGVTLHRSESAPVVLLDFVFSLIFLMPSLHLHKYASRIRAFVAQGHMVQLESAMEAQRRFWKFTGLCALLSVILLTLAAAFGLA